MRGSYHRSLSRAEILHIVNGAPAKNLEKIVVSYFMKPRYNPSISHESSYHWNLRLYWKHRRESFAGSRWDWQPTVPVAEILNEIATHAKLHPDWLEICVTL